MALIGVGVVSACGVVALVVYKVLSKLNIISKKIDPRKIRIFYTFD
jgi:hypothetical protein